jgi:hypothetical protein
VCGGQGQGVVDPVADHQHLGAGLLEVTDRGDFVLRHQPGTDIADADLFAESSGGPGIITFDDFRLADMLPTPVTVVASDTAELGRIAARLLLDRTAGTDTRPPQRIVLPCALVRRGSGERPPA